MSNIVNLLPVILIAVGALASLAAEPFIKDENKHKILPWVASFFIALAAGAVYLLSLHSQHRAFLLRDDASGRDRQICRNQNV